MILLMLQALMHVYNQLGECNNKYSTDECQRSISRYGNNDDEIDDNNVWKSIF